MAHFFIDRPIFAWVIAISLMLAGVGSITTLPVEEYPEISPVTISIAARYPGASAKTVEDSMTQVIEQHMKGLDGLLYMAASSDSSGSMTLNLTFSSDTDPDIAQVQVQNKLSLATPFLPQEVQRQGVQVNKHTSGFLLVISFVNEDGSMTDIDMADYVASNLVDVVSRIEGVGEVRVFGGSYAMRIWLNPEKLEAYKLTPGDVVRALQGQNIQLTAGKIGSSPAVPGQQIAQTVTSQERFSTPQEFEQVRLRSEPDGSIVRLKDVARIDLGSETYSNVARYNRKPATGIGIVLATGANAMDTADAVKAKLAELEEFFPPGMVAMPSYDATPFVKVSINQVVQTLIEAIILVVLVMLIFLQNIRATLIPTLAVPVILLGTFLSLKLFGYTINTLTMFAMVLAIGLLVDDAIVVVENVERLMREEKLSAREATRKSMTQITGALIGIGIVLSAVYVPMAFFDGSVGVIYRQFSITIVSAMALSVIVAIIFTPALCATMLKEHDGKEPRGFAKWFNRGFEKLTDAYGSLVAHMMSKWAVLYGALFLGLVALTGLLFISLPTSFLPNEDQGALLSMAQGPSDASQERTVEVVKMIEDHFLENEGDLVQSVFAMAGFSFGGVGQNMAMAWVRLKHWDDRQEPDQRSSAIARRAGLPFSQIKRSMVFAFQPPVIRGLGTSSGFTMQLIDRAGQGHEALLAARDELMGLAAQNPRLVNVRPDGMAEAPQLRLDIDQDKAAALGVSMAEINETLSTAWGSRYVNDFIQRGRVKRVYVQADAPYRMMPDDFFRWYVRNDKGEMVNLSSFAEVVASKGAPKLERFNSFPSYQITGEAAPGVSSGDAMDEMEAMVRQLPDGFDADWSHLSFQERQSTSSTGLLYALSLLVVFLSLAALYESWSVPFAVMLVVPLGILGAILATMWRDMTNDVYFQVGMLTTVGLSAKNAILIVEFAKDLVDEGMDVFKAVLLAAKQRLRPILMTSLAFGLGVLPLALSVGAGSASRNAVGTSVLGGMVTATTLGIFYVPLFFVAVRKVFSRGGKPQAPTQPTESSTSSAI